MSSPSRLVSIVDEDETLREAISRAIRLEHHRTSTFGETGAARDAFTRALPDCVVISSGAPGGDSLALVRELRERSATVAIIVTAAGDDDLERLLALDPGADDYLAKPFTIKDLLPRVKALLRRAGLTGAEALAWEDRPLTLGALTVDPLRLTAQLNGSSLGLPVTEFFVLLSLVRRAGTVKTRDQILQETFPGRSSVAAAGVVDRLVARLQQRFDRLSPGFDALEGVHGAGYRYRAARRA